MGESDLGQREKTPFILLPSARARALSAYIFSFFIYIYIYIYHIWFLYLAFGPLTERRTVLTGAELLRPMACSSSTHIETPGTHTHTHTHSLSLYLYISLLLSLPVCDTFMYICIWFSFCIFICINKKYSQNLPLYICVPILFGGPCNAVFRPLSLSAVSRPSMPLTGQ